MADERDFFIGWAGPSRRSLGFLIAVSLGLVAIFGGTAAAITQLQSSPGAVKRDWKAEYTGVRTFEVYSDYSKGCMDDIRLEGKHLPLPPALNGTQWGQATMARNLKRNCPSNNPCANVICPNPFVCVDLWMEYECS